MSEHKEKTDEREVVRGAVSHVTWRVLPRQKALMPYRHFIWKTVPPWVGSAAQGGHLIREGFLYWHLAIHNPNKIYFEDLFVETHLMIDKENRENKIISGKWMHKYFLWSQRYVCHATHDVLCQCIVKRGGNDGLKSTERKIKHGIIR